MIFIKAQRKDYETKPKKKKTTKELRYSTTYEQTNQEPNQIGFK